VYQHVNPGESVHKREQELPKETTNAV